MYNHLTVIVNSWYMQIYRHILYWTGMSSFLIKICFWQKNKQQWCTHPPTNLMRWHWTNIMGNCHQIVIVDYLYVPITVQRIIAVFCEIIWYFRNACPYLVLFVFRSGMSVSTVTHISNISLQIYNSNTMQNYIMEIIYFQLYNISHKIKITSNWRASSYNSIKR